MKFRLKKLATQTIVITGASRGIGLTTAREAAQRGAKVVLAARNGEVLKRIHDDLTERGCEAIHVVADVGKIEDVRRLAQETIKHFGGFDTWVNNASVSTFLRNGEMSLQDQRRLFDTNFWGAVHGSLVAVEHLKQRGGALINMGSEASDFATPLQGMYSASKQAVKAFTDSLRMELEEEGAPVSVTLIKPSPIDTSFVARSRNYKPKAPSPIYRVDLVANAILLAAENPKRDIFVGGSVKLSSAGSHYAPHIADKDMERYMFTRQQSNTPANARDDNILYKPQGYEGNLNGLSRDDRKIYPAATSIMSFGVGFVLGALYGLRRH